MALSPEQMAAMQTYQQELVARRLRAAAVGTGATGKAIRGGDAAGYTEAMRPWVEGGVDREAAWMTGDEKLDRKGEVTAQLAQQEQFYFAKEQEQRLEQFRESQNNWRAVLAAQQQHFSTSSANQRAQAELQTSRLQYLVNKSYQEEEDLYKPSESGAAEAVAMAAEVKAVSEADVGAQVDRLIQERRAAVGDPNWRPSEMEMMAIKDAAGNAASAQFPGLSASDMKAAAFALRAQETLEMHSDNPKEALAIIRAAADEAGVSLDSVGAMDPGIQSAIQQADDAVELERLAIVEKRLSDQQEWTRRASSTHGASGQYAARLQELDQAVGQEKAKLDAQKAEKLGTLVAPGAAPQKPRGASVASSDFQVEGPPALKNAEGVPMDTMFGLPVQPASDAQQRTLQMLDLIEEYPDHPPLRQARDELMKSPEYLGYKKARGYDGLNDSDVLREMSREFRKQSRANTAEFRDRRKQNIDMGISAGFGPKGRPAPNTRSVPVAGSGE